jgi:hypothetical protein
MKVAHTVSSSPSSSTPEAATSLYLHCLNKSQYMQQGKFHTGDVLIATVATGTSSPPILNNVIFWKVDYSH